MDTTPVPTGSESRPLQAARQKRGKSRSSGENIGAGGGVPVFGSLCNQGPALGEACKGPWASEIPRRRTSPTANRDQAFVMLDLRPCVESPLWNWLTKTRTTVTTETTRHEQG